MQKEVQRSLLDRLARYVAWRVFISVVYITGLTLLIPLVFLYIFPDQVEGLVLAPSPVILWLSLAMVAAGFIVTLWHTKSLGGSLKSLGRITFVPGLIGLVFSFFGRDTMLLYLAGTLPKFQQAQPLLETYLDNAVPRVRFLTFSLFILGALLWFVGDKLERDAAMLLRRR